MVNLQTHSWNALLQLASLTRVGKLTPPDLVVCASFTDSLHGFITFAASFLSGCEAVVPPLPLACSSSRFLCVVFVLWRMWQQHSIPAE